MVTRTWATRGAATLGLDSGEELRVDLERDDLDRDEILVRRANDDRLLLEDRLAVIDTIIATAESHPSGTTDRLIAADRER